MEFVRDLSGALNRLGTRRNFSVNIAMKLCRKASFAGISDCISTRLLKPGAMDQPEDPFSSAYSSEDETMTEQNPEGKHVTNFLLLLST